VQQFGITYSVFINLLKKKQITLDRKIIATLAVEYPLVFKKLVEKAK